MPRKSRNDLKTTFVNGYIPDQDDYCDLFDSFIHKEDDVISIDLGGNVGVGTNSPTKLFHVAGDVQVDGVLCANNIDVPNMGMIPSGGIIMWNGTTVPAGWKLCNGQNGTPDLRGRFIVGLTNSDTSNHGYNNTEKNKSVYNSIGNNGGLFEVKLTSTESALPSHNHDVIDPKHSHGYSDKFSPESGAGYRSGQNRKINFLAEDSKTTNPSSTNISIDTKEIVIASSAHENRPPYYVLAFIMKQ